MGRFSQISILAPDLSGGGGTRAYLLAQAMQRLGCSVRVLGFLFGDRLYPEPPPEIPVDWVRGANYPEFWARSRELIDRIDGDLIYAIKPRPTSLGIGLRARRRLKVPLCLDIDDWEMSWFGGDRYRYRLRPRQVARDLLKRDGALRRPEHPLYIRRAEGQVGRVDGLTVDTRFLQDRYGGVYLPNGRDTDGFDPAKFDPDACRRSLGLGDFRVLMFPGTARPHKGLEDALEALDRLDQPDLRLAIVGGRMIGDGYLERLQERWPRWLIHLPGVPAAEMPAIVAAAHAVIVPQRDAITAQAQFPMKLTDGMAMAKPIIATTVGDIPEILADTGYLVPPNDPAAIAAAITTLFADYPTAQDRGARSRDRCQRLYSTATMATILADLFDRL
ncbi:MAG: glycosyltransferase family 4 protein [Cyanobacteria bacterium]|nr:glycosyltransferase family 4 protein [Cyanobacteriota bacterium]